MISFFSFFEIQNHDPLVRRKYEPLTEKRDRRARDGSAGIQHRRIPQTIGFQYLRSLAPQLAKKNALNGHKGSPGTKSVCVLCCSFSAASGFTRTSTVAPPPAICGGRPAITAGDGLIVTHLQAVRLPPNESARRDGRSRELVLLTD